MRSLLLFASLLAVSASAQVFQARGTLALSLDRRALTASAGADVIVTDRVVQAAHGIRLEAGQQAFRRSAAVSLDAPYLVRDARGEPVRMWVRTIAGDQVVVEVQRLRPGAGLSPGAPRGRYRAASVTVNGAPAQPTFGDLMLEADGRYRQGSASGRWAFDNGQLRFEGAIVHWGVAVPAPEGDGVVFEFDRGAFHWVVRFEKVPEAAPDEAVAAR
jgi:hypothetical protein